MTNSPAAQKIVDEMRAEESASSRIGFLVFSWMAGILGCILLQQAHQAYYAGAVLVGGFAVSWWAVKAQQPHEMRLQELRKRLQEQKQKEILEQAHGR